MAELLRYRWSVTLIVSNPGSQKTSLLLWKYAWFIGYFYCCLLWPYKENRCFTFFLLKPSHAVLQSRIFLVYSSYYVTFSENRTLTESIGSQGDFVSELPDDFLFSSDKRLKKIIITKIGSPKMLIVITSFIFCVCVYLLNAWLILILRI